MTVNVRKYPLHHLSIIVPWHDSGWAGIVCQAPTFNDACLKLKRIADGRNDVNVLSAQPYVQPPGFATTQVAEPKAVRGLSQISFP